MKQKDGGHFLAEHFLERLKSPFFVEILIRSCFCLKERGVRTRPTVLYDLEANRFKV